MMGAQRARVGERSTRMHQHSNPNASGQQPNDRARRRNRALEGRRTGPSVILLPWSDDLTEERPETEPRPGIDVRPPPVGIRPDALGAAVGSDVMDAE